MKTFEMKRPKEFRVDMVFELPDDWTEDRLLDALLSIADHGDGRCGGTVTEIDWEAEDGQD